MKQTRKIKNFSGVDKLFLSTIKELRSKSHSLDPVLNIGKNGVTASVVKEVNLKLKKNKLIKVKFLSSAGDRKKLVEELVSGTEATLIRSVGRIVVLYKR